MFNVEPKGYPAFARLPPPLPAAGGGGGGGGGGYYTARRPNEGSGHRSAVTDRIPRDRPKAPAVTAKSRDGLKNTDPMYNGD